jgi:hypothetical protein
MWLMLRDRVYPLRRRRLRVWSLVEAGAVGWRRTVIERVWRRGLQWRSRRRRWLLLDVLLRHGYGLGWRRRRRATAWVIIVLR